MSTEELFMYLAIGLIIVVPVRVYHYLTAKQVQQMLRQEFGKAGAQGRPQDPGKKP